jgi:ubiquinone/menaquinone biosynthesis C-methylase UbiE
MSEIQKQRDYYKQIACNYDAACVFNSNDEHFIGAAALSGLIQHYKLESLLDVGCGTGRSLLYLRKHHPIMQLKGVEPVVALREVAISKGLSEVEIADGDACKLDFPDCSFDCVTAFGVLHHIPNPAQAIQEMKRVARRAIFISDHNVYGMGSVATKSIKQMFRDFGLKGVLKLMLTRGKGYHDTNWDGIFYPFSIVDYFDAIKFEDGQTFTFSTKGCAINLYREASHLAVFSIKKSME